MDMAMDDKLINDVTQNYPFCRLQLLVERARWDTQLNKPINQNLTKVLKAIDPTNKKTLL